MTDFFMPTDKEIWNYYAQRARFGGPGQEPGFYGNPQANGWGNGTSSLGIPSNTFGGFSTSTNISGNTPSLDAMGLAEALAKKLGIDPSKNVAEQYLNHKGLWGQDMGWWQGVNTVGQLGIGAFNLWNAIQANKFNKQQLAFQQEAFNKNWNANFGTEMQHFSDTLGARAASEGLTGDARDSYITTNLANLENQIKTGKASAGMSAEQARAAQNRNELV